MNSDTLTISRLRQLLTYNPDTGEFRWVSKRAGVRFDGHVGAIGKAGYRYIVLDRKKYLAHRLAWMYMNGSLPVFVG